ncbi:MAG TPA: acyl-CoA dehydrogenase [Halieaceae bacterium]|uniref:acyl-CoA dehydrogenase family protein n=1 Tax=Pseudohaliea sp. TaxID=2740289 RepID=UPI000EBC0F05|nr:acyl-CoA dehydrogenase [Halieaceae bacterium]
MSWSFETDPEFQQKLDWIDTFTREEIEPLDLVFRGPGDPWDPDSPAARAMAPLREIVKKEKLWACHLGPELGGEGYGQVKLGLMNEILGRSRFGPSVFGCQAPDSGNAEILAHFGTPEQKAKYLQPLLDGKIASCYSMTEPHAGADPAEFTCTAERDGDEWVINGEKWFASHARFSEFLLVMVVTNKDVPIHKGASMLLVEKGTPGMEIIRNCAVGPYVEQGDGVHGYLRFSNCRVPAENLLGEEGGGFLVAQTRLGGGRVHHAMRSVGVLKKAMDMMCERVKSRRTKGELLADKQTVQEKIADSYTQILQYRLHVLYTAWLIDKYKEYNREVRKEIAAIKAATPKVLQDVIYRVMHLHGSWGMSDETPLMTMWANIPELGVVDGPSEVHKITVARTVLRDYEPSPGLFPTYHTPTQREAALKKYGHYLED